MKRRNFIKNSIIFTAASSCISNKYTNRSGSHDIKIQSHNIVYEKEKLIRELGFKGNFLTELWQVAVQVTSDTNTTATGLAIQSILYADAELFAMHSENGGNQLMFDLTKEALHLAQKTPFKDPVELLDKILPAVYEKGKKLTKKENLNVNFLYNALVSVDNAAWLLYAKENKYTDFDAMLPSVYKKALSYHNKKLAVLFSASYNMPMSEIIAAVNAGYFTIKIKTGQPGSQEEMLQKDMERLNSIHKAIKKLSTPQKNAGKIYYTMDANGRYEKKETLTRFLNYAREIGAFEHILVYEEPFVEGNNENVSDLGILIAADESVHTEADALKRIAQGYGALVLKGIAKTLSLSIKIAKVAYDRSIPCMCADLTVNPILIDWHKNLAARLQPFPKINMGLIETNGHINYRNWNAMTQYHPLAGAEWMKIKNGVFNLDEDFYKTSGGIFFESSHYERMNNSK